ncbi:hypothetical protein [Merismopedia glauca]|uniref:Uncharacterized protein n=1 Tax=Merismopedia glauca CCAP 1448/3 TaxID=1296344 RepID=A0A2T1C8P5_9CYAN|nr:hypothetical protein [Merismopedia glauca]PSB04645.1 hypothetical protein C7B64_02885 [Merismopedia glauca CCAP 1448/3]
MAEFMLEYKLYLLAILHFAIGAAAGIVAWRKGYSLTRWLLFGAVGGTVALVTALWIKPSSSS